MVKDLMPVSFTLLHRTDTVSAPHSALCAGSVKGR